MAYAYVFSDFIVPPLDQILSLETRLESLYSVDMLQGSTCPVG